MNRECRCPNGRIGDHRVHLDTISAVSSLELIRADTAHVAAATRSIVERFDVIGYVGEC